VPASTSTSSSAVQSAAAPQLHSHIDQQKGKPAAAHVLRVLHCGSVMYDSVLRAGSKLLSTRERSEDDCSGQVASSLECAGLDIC
jgi:hypothetical protein